jgi:hypothetical protein
LLEACRRNSYSRCPATPSTARYRRSHSSTTPSSISACAGKGGGGGGAALLGRQRLREVGRRPRAAAHRGSKGERDLAGMRAWFPQKDPAP